VGETMLGELEQLRRENTLLHARIGELEAQSRSAVQYETGWLFHSMQEGYGLFEVVRNAAGKPVDYRVLAVNPAFEKMTGTKAQALTGRSVREVLPRLEDFWFERGNRVAASGEPVRIEGSTSFLDRIFEVIMFPFEANRLACIFIDITEQRAAEDSLRHSETQLSAAQQIAHIGSFSEDAATGEVTWSPELFSILGLDPEHTVPSFETYFQRIHVDDRDQVLATYAKYRNAEGEAWDSQHRIVQKSTGEIRYIDTRNGLTVDASGKLLRSTGVIQDVTEHTKMQYALRQSEERFRSLVEQAADALYVHDADGKILEVNQQACLSLAYSREELLSLTIFDIEMDAGIAEAREAWRSIPPGGAVTFNGTHRHKDGTMFPVEVRVGRIELHDAPVYLALARDITEREQAEKALRESEARYRTILHSAMDGIWRLGMDGRILEVNEAGCRMTGYSEQELLQMQATDLVPADSQEQTLRRLQQILNERECRFEGWLRRKDGSVFPTEVNVQCSADGAGYLVGFVRDATGKKRAEAELQQSEAKARAIVESLVEGVIFVDNQGRLQSANDAARQLLGERIVELGGPFPHQLVDVLGSDGKVLMEEERPVWKALRKGERVSGLELGIPNPGGRITWLIANAQPVRERTGHLLGVVASYIDITERKRAQQELLRANLRVNLALESGKFGLWEWDIDAKHLHWDERNLALYGFTKGEFAPRFEAWRERVHPEDQGRVMAEVSSALANGHRYETEFRIVHPNGGIRHIRGNATVVRDSQGVPVRLLGLSRDVTSRKLAEAEKKQRVELIESIFANIPVMLAFYESPHSFALVNQALTRILGWTLEDCQREDFTQLCYPDVKERERVIQFMQSGSGWVDCRTTAKDGSIVVTSWINVKMSDGRSIGIGQDIGDRKRAEEEREKLRAELAQAQKMECVGRLAGGVAHDFNNLLTVINGYSELALRKLRPGDPLHRYLYEIKTCGDRATALTRQLLAFSRKQVLQPRVLDLNVVVKEMHTMLERLVGEDVLVTFTLFPAELHVYADPHQLEQVIMNLAVNARDAMPQGGRLRIETGNVTSAEVRSAFPFEPAAGIYVVVAVIDTGAGMDEATRSRVFEPFFTTKAAGKGTGLGLATVQGIIAQSNGCIDLESAPGMGTTFRIYLPAITACVLETPAGAPVPNVAGTETILIVEDQEEVREFTAASLKTFGYHVIAASNAGEALLIVERSEAPIDLVLSDMVMPYMSGLELVQRLRQAQPAIRSVLMTGYAEDFIAEKGTLNAGVEVIQKPFTPEELALRVRAALGPQFKGGNGIIQ